MPQTRTTDPKDSSDPQVTEDGSTHTSAAGKASPRQPNEHDESSDSGSRPPDPQMAQAAKDVQSGKQPTDRGETTDEVYGQNLRGSAGDRR